MAAVTRVSGKFRKGVIFLNISHSEPLLQVFHLMARELLFCMNDVLMFHINSGSYRVLEIDYAYQALTLHEPHLSTCDDIVLGGRGNGFAIEPWRAPYLVPDGDNVFMLIGCSARSPLFQGFPNRHLPCQNVSGMGCEDYYACPAWSVIDGNRVGGSGEFLF